MPEHQLRFEQWAAFYVILSAASTTLLGLLFVVISLAAERGRRDAPSINIYLTPAVIFDGCVVLDNKGFIKTGRDLSSEELTGAHWPLARRPDLLESSVPGKFAAGDVRGGNSKRVAFAVGEGSFAISFIHQTLRE